jgi:hemolysin activation/secretion protein
MLQTIGGHTTLRAFDDFRFRGENALVLNAEYRWAVRKFLDVAFFADAGKVAHHFEDVHFKGLMADFGVGLRLHSESRLFMRFDIARGREGTRYLLRLSPAF